MSITFTSDDDLLQLQTELANIGRGKSRFKAAANSVIAANRMSSLRSSFRRVSIREALKEVVQEEEDEYENVTPTSTEPADKRSIGHTTLPPPRASRMDSSARVWRLSDLLIMRLDKSGQL